LPHDREEYVKFRGLYRPHLGVEASSRKSSPLWVLNMNMVLARHLISAGDGGGGGLFWEELATCPTGIARHPLKKGNTSPPSFLK